MDQQISDLNETIELLSLDKEQLALEKELLEEQVKELELENRKLKSSSTAAPSSPFVNKELKFLQEENEKLKEALLKLHEKETKEKEQLTASDAKLQELQSIAAQFEEYKKQKDAEISDLLAQIDSLSHFEFLIEKLTGENLDLRQAVEVQKQSLVDLEESQDLNEQLDEHQRKQISEHLKTIDSLEMKISSLEKKIFEKDVLNNDLNKKLETFNQTVRNLQAQNTELNVFLKKENSLLVHYEKNIKNLISFIHENYEQSSFSFSHHQLTFQQGVNYQKSILFNQRYEFLVNSSFASLWMEENKYLNFENILLSLTAYNFEMENVLLNIYNVLKPFFRILLADKHSKTRENSSSTSSSSSIHNEKLQSLQKLLLMILQIYNFSVLQQNVFHSLLMNQIQDSTVSNNPIMNHSQQIFLLKNELETFVNELNFILQNILKNKTTLAITELNSASSSSSTSFLATSSLSQAPSLDFQESVGSEKRLLAGEVVDSDAAAAASEEATNNAANLIDIHEFENYYSKCIHSYHSIARCLEQISATSSASVVVSPSPASSSASSSPLHTLLQSVITKSENSEMLLQSSVLFVNGMVESLSCSHRCSSTSSSAVGNKVEDNELTEMLRSIKIENESFLVNLKASSSASSSSSAASTSAMQLIEASSLQHLLHATTSLLDSYGMFSLASSSSESIGKLKDVLGVLRKWNSAIGAKATTGNHEMPVLTYFPSISFVFLVGQWNQSLTVTSSLNSNEKKFLEMNYSQLLEKYWKLLFQDNHEWLKNSNNSNDGAVTISWKKRMNKIRDAIAAATAASTQSTKSAAITENQSLNESESGKFTPATSQKAELAQQQHVQKELDMKKEQLKSALSRCDELNNLYQNAMNSLQQAAAANSLETRENFEKEQTKLKDEIHTLETALKTMETKIDTLNKENRQLKSSSSANAVSALQALASDSDKAGPVSSATTTTTTGGGGGAGTVRGGRLDRRRQTTGNAADMNDPKAMLAALASLGGVGGDVNPSPPAVATTRTAERKQSIHQLLSPAPASSSSSSSVQQSLEDHPMIMEHIFHWKQMMVKMLTNSLLPLEAPSLQHQQQQQNIQLSNNLQAVIPQRYEDDPRRNIKAVYYESRLNRVRSAKIAAIQVKSKPGEEEEEEGKEHTTPPPTFRSKNRYLYQQEPIVFQLVK
jgi:DNA repair exonuclease SbcCD ATPase subunit